MLKIEYFIQFCPKYIIYESMKESIEKLWLFMKIELKMWNQQHFKSQRNFLHHPIYPKKWIIELWNDFTSSAFRNEYMYVAH